VQRKANGASNLYGRYILSLRGTQEHFQIEALPVADHSTITLSCDGLRWDVSCNQVDAQAVSRLLPNLLDFCTAGAIATQESSGLVLVQREEDRVLLAASSIFAQPGKIAIRCLPMPKMIPTDFLFASNDQSAATKQNFAVFSQWLGVLLPHAAPGTMLFVKLDPSALWFMRFPLTSYIRFQLGEFTNFININWIVTDRSFSEVVYSRDQLRKGLGDLATLLRGTVIIVNRYAHHIKSIFGPQVIEAVEILRLFLGRLKDVQVKQEQYTLRFVIDPVAHEIMELLLDKTTRFVFADFHTVAGKWQLGDYRERGDPPEIPLGAVDFSLLKDKLQHVQLLRIFHCNSAFVFDQLSDNAPDDGAQPAAPDTTVRQLLESGAQIVEGGITTESFFEFFYSVIQLLFSTSLYFVLKSASLSDPSFGFTGAVARCNKLLRARGFDSISVS